MIFFQMSLESRLLVLYKVEFVALSCPNSFSKTAVHYGISSTLKSQTYSNYYVQV